MNKIQEIKALTSELLSYCHAYYVLDAPLVTDKEYDSKYDRLKQLEDEAGFWLSASPTRKVQGSVLECFKKVAHSKPMLSAKKTKDLEDVIAFIGSDKFYCSYKCDGLTLVVKYVDGKFKQAITRGNGEIGEDVTEQAKMISNLPLTIPYKAPLELRGECVIDWKNFYDINRTLSTPYSHPRNLAAGSLRQLDPQITKQRNLSYVVFECVSELSCENGPEDSKILNLEYLDKLGFTTVGRALGSIVLCNEAMQPEFYQYPVDGLIFELDSKECSMQKNNTAHHEGCRIALKWADEDYPTALRDIEWNVGRTGVLTPTAVFEPVEIDGTMVERASLHNLSIVKKILGEYPYRGQSISVYKANMIIPQIAVAAIATSPHPGLLDFPSVCPVCGGKVIIKRENNTEELYCSNPDCTAKQLAGFVHFVSRKCANIEGLSEKTLELLIAHGYLHKFTDIYELKNHKQQLMELEGMGEKSVLGLLEAIESSRDIRMENFINALGIPNIGLTASKTITEFFDNNFYEFTHALEHRFNFTILSDFGQVMNQSLYDWWGTKQPLTEALLKYMRFVHTNNTTIQNDEIEGKTFVVTGAFNTMKRTEIEKAIVDRGGKLTGSVSKNTDYLLTNNAESGSGKAKKAKELNIPIMDETAFIKLLEKS